MNGLVENSLLAAVEMEAGSRRADHRHGRPDSGMARTVDLGGLDPITRLPTADRVHRTVSGFYPDSVCWYTAQEFSATSTGRTSGW
jgi:hypothetical protein